MAEASVSRVAASTIQSGWGITVIVASAKPNKTKAVTHAGQLWRSATTMAAALPTNTPSAQADDDGDFGAKRYDVDDCLERLRVVRG